MVDWQSESDLDSIRNSCDVFNLLEQCQSLVTFLTMNVWLIKPDQSIDFAAGSIWIEPSKFDDLWSRSNYVWAKRAIQTFW